MAALEVSGRIVLGGDREMDVAVDIVEHGLHQSAAAGEEGGEFDGQHYARVPAK